MDQREALNQLSDAIQHEQAAELLEDYILGTLPVDQQEQMDHHLASCAICQEELGPLMSAVQALPFAAPEPDVQMSDDLWDRISRGIAGKEPRVADTTFVPLAEQPDAWTVVPAAPEPTRFSSRQWLLVAALMLVSLIGGALLGQVLPRFGEDQPKTQQIAIQFTDPNITATGELRYLPDEEIFVLSINDMPAAPEGYVYQAWLIQGDAPIPAGVMDTSQGELASVGDRSQFDAFAITVEPGPFGNQEPSSDPILVAPLHGSDEG